MAHVLLPCDLPFWSDVLQSLSQVKACNDCRQLIQHLSCIHRTCSVSLDPDEDVNEVYQLQLKVFRELGYFLKNGFSEEERCRFLSQTLPFMVFLASRLQQLRPQTGFFYSLKLEEQTFHLERELVASLLANAFFSTFPKRSSKTHPTLQDFNFVNFFSHLNNFGHRQKLKSFFRYFERFESRGDFIRITRKMMTGPSLSSWLCCKKPLQPLSVRKNLSQYKDYRVCSSSPINNGGIWKVSNLQESSLYFTHPELLVILCFVENLVDSEILLVENVSQAGAESSYLNFCLFEMMPNGQLDDQSLQHELNRAFTALNQESPTHSKRSVSPDSSSGERISFVAQSSSESYSKSSSFSNRNKSRELSDVDKRYSRDSSFSERSQSLHSRIFYVGDSCEEKSKPSRSNMDSKKHFRTKKWVSARSTSQSSGRSQKEEQREDESYYTADDDSEDGACEDASSYRSDSVGFVLGEHERLEDFRKRIRKRTRRRLSRRRSSYLSSSSDMEDISEEDPAEVKLIRVATSEPSLVTSIGEQSVLCQEAEALMLRGRKKMMVTSSDGRLKAYSYDGVSPNLPVPFKAKFRRRRIHESTSQQVEKRVVLFDDMNLIQMIILWLAASMTESEICLDSVSGESQQMISKISSRANSKKWTVGDLCRQILRLSRNVSPEVFTIDDLFPDENF